MLAVRPEQISEFSPPGLSQRVGRRLPGRVDFDSIGGHLRGLGDGLPKRKAERLGNDSDPEWLHDTGPREEAVQHAEERGNGSISTPSGVSAWSCSRDAVRKSENGLTISRNAAVGRWTVSALGLRVRIASR